MQANVGSTANAGSPGPRRRRLWPWFVGRFLLVFVGMLLLVHMIVMQPSGRYAVRASLWQYHADSLPQLFGTSHLGPASGNTSVLAETGLFSLAVLGSRRRSGGCRWVVGPQSSEPVTAERVPVLFLFRDLDSRQSSPRCKGC